MKEYIKFLQLNYPELIDDMSKCSHHYSVTNLNPYHLEGDVLTHTLMVTKLSELIIENDENNIKIAALLHDIGKPESREIDHDNKKVKFYGHAGISFWKSIEIINKLFPTYDNGFQMPHVGDKEEILSLISLHILMMDLKDKPTKLKHKFKNNEELLRRLAKLYYCDSNGRFAEDSYATRKEILDIGSVDVIEESYIKKPNEIILLCGLPCSGKSTYIKDNNTLLRNYNIISRDNILMELANTDDYQEAWTKVDHNKVNSVLEERFIGAIHNRHDVIIDMTNMSKKSRNKFTCRIPKKEYNKKCVLFATELSEIKRRNIKRAEQDKKLIPDKVFLDMMKAFTLPMYDEVDEIEWKFN